MKSVHVTVLLSLAFVSLISCSSNQTTKEVEDQNSVIEYGNDGYNGQIALSAIVSRPDWSSVSPPEALGKLRSRVTFSVARGSKYVSLAFRKDGRPRDGVRVSLKFFLAKSTALPSDSDLRTAALKYKTSELELRRLLGDWHIAALKVQGVGYVMNVWYPASAHPDLSDPPFFFVDYDKPLENPNFEAKPTNLSGAQLRWMYTVHGNEPLWFGTQGGKQVAFAPLNDKTYAVIANSGAMGPALVSTGIENRRFSLVEQP